MRGAAPFGRGRFYLTDVNFVRLVDFHNSARQDLRILLPRNRKTYLLRWQARVGNNWVDKWEWEIPTGSRVVHLDRLRGGLPGTTFKGSIRPLLANLFALPHDQAVVDNYQPADIELLVREATFEASPVNRIILRYGLANGFLAEASVTSRVTLGYMRRVGKLELGWLVGYGGAGYQRDDGVVVDYHEMLTHGALTYRPLWRDR